MPEDWLSEDYFQSQTCRDLLQEIFPRQLAEMIHPAHNYIMGGQISVWEAGWHLLPSAIVDSYLPYSSEELQLFVIRAWPTVFF